MIGVIISAFMIILLAVVMEIAASALKLTGLDIHTARFQALSALTGTGFTTKETELIMNHKQRRRIIMSLMVLGPIGFITILGSVLFSIGEKVIVSQLLVIMIVFLVILLITRSEKIMSLFHRGVEKQLRKRKYPRRIILEQVLQLNKDYGVCEIMIGKNSKSVDRPLSGTDFKEKGFMVLAIERQEGLLTVPKGSDVLREGDVLIVFGNLKSLEQATKESI
ncbi:MAG: TrkA C-terminal domain-containing protein [Candidatus Omnitrophota bacterium]